MHIEIQAIYTSIKKDIETMGGNISEVKEINYGVQFNISFSGENSVVRIFNSKKKGTTVDLSQIKSESIKKLLVDIGCTPNKKKVKKDNSKSTFITDIVPLIGTDESGKGDYFGPLTIGAVYADNKQLALLEEFGVRDSKTISDKKIFELEKSIKQICEYRSVIRVGNQRYNELYYKMQNISKLLAWGHAKAISNILKVKKCDTVITDKFGSSHWLENSLKKENITLIQVPRAEENLAVAAGSILARAEYVRSIENMAKAYGMQLSKGANNIVIAQAKDFVKKYGRDELKKIAKIHFKTTTEII